MNSIIWLLRTKEQLAASSLDLITGFYMDRREADCNKKKHRSLDRQQEVKFTAKERPFFCSKKGKTARQGRAEHPSIHVHEHEARKSGAIH
jgi:hypothetical protein